MTILNSAIAPEYFALASNGNATGHLSRISDATDKAMEAVIDVFEAAGLKFPGDDRCAEIEVAIYAAAKSVNPQQ